MGSGGPQHILTWPKLRLQPTADRTTTREVPTVSLRRCHAPRQRIHWTRGEAVRWFDLLALLESIFRCLTCNAGLICICANTNLDPAAPAL